MSLQQNRRVSFSDMNRSLTVTNGNTGIGTTAPSHMLDVNGGVRSTNFTTTNALITTAVATTFTGGSIGLTGAANAVTGTIGTFVTTTVSASTAVATTYTGGSMSLSGNLAIGGTLTTVNITTTNISETNVSAGTVSATNIGVTTQTVGTSRITTSLLAIGNSNTVGSIYTTGGNVGIGSTSPSYTLDVNGNGRFVNGLTIATGQPGIFTNKTITSNTNFGLIYCSDRPTGGNLGSHLFCNSNASVAYVTIDGPSYTFDVTGNLRVSTNANIPSAQITNSAAGGYAGFNLTNNLRDWYLAVGGSGTGSGTADKFYIGNASNVNMITLISSGNLGVGTASPRSNLEITQSSSTTGVMLYSGLNDGGVNSVFFHHSDRSQGDYRKVAIQTQALGSGQAARANLALCVNIANDNTNVTMSDAKLFIQGSSGNIGIGTTAPSGMLHLSGSALFTSAGNLTCTGDIISFGSLSDRRLKKNIETIDKNVAVDIVSRLRGVKFDWREDVFNESKRNTGDIGFIAQEIEELIPEAVSEYTEVNSGEVYKRIKHERLIPLLLVTVQYLLEKMDK